MLLRSVLAAALITGALFAAPMADAATPGSIQVPGSKLESALPSSAYFGHGAMILNPYNTGGTLVHYPAIAKAAKTVCETTLILTYIDAGWGQTAIASETAQHTLGTYTVQIGQFANARTASAVFDAQRAKAASCRSYSLPPLPGSTRHVWQSVTGTRVGGHPAFIVKQQSSYSNVPGVTVPGYVLVTVDGSDLFTEEISGTPEAQPSGSAITLYMIGKVSALR
jgi:hypothetical protein